MVVMVVVVLVVVLVVDGDASQWPDLSLVVFVAEFTYDVRAPRKITWTCLTWAYVFGVSLLILDKVAESFHGEQYRDDLYTVRIKACLIPGQTPYMYIVPHP